MIPDTQTQSDRDCDFSLALIGVEVNNEDKGNP